jgi:hypothetical protein
MMTYAHVSVGAGQAVEIRWRTTAGTATAQARTLNLFPVASADVSQATDTANATLNSATYTLLTGMTLSPAAGTYLALFSTSADGVSGSIIDTSLFVGGAQIAHTERSVTQEASIPNTAFVHAIVAKVTVTAGQAVEVRWKNSGTAGNITAYQRTLTLYKVDPASISEATATTDATSTATTDGLLTGMTLTPGAGTYLALFSSTYRNLTGGTQTISSSLYVNAVQTAASQRQPVWESSLDNTNIPVATNDVVSPGAGQAVEVWWRGSITETRTARARTLVLLKQPEGTITLSSAANQTFTVGQAAALASTMTVTDGSTPTITAAQDLRIRIPAGLNMTFDPAVTTVALGGTAAGRVSATPTYEPGNKVVVLNVTSNFAAGETLTIDGLKFGSFSAASAATSLELVVAGSGGATAATDNKTITIIAPATLSSAANQSFTLGQGSTTAATITVTDSSAATITTSQEIRIRIPAALNMTWDTSVTTITRGGTASGKVSATLLTYEDGNKTAVINVTSNFAASDQLTIDGLKFTNFSAASAANSLQLVVSGSGGATAATDDKTITIIAFATLSSAAHQFFTVGQSSATAATITVTDGSTPTITATQDLRIRIPAGFNMTFDTTVTSVTLGGGATGKMSGTLLAYEDGNKTAVLNVTSNFAGGDQLTIAGLKFANFSAASSASNLQLVVAGSGGATAATDDKLITIVLPSTLSLSSAANQTFTAGQGSTAAIMMTVTDGPTPAINATQNIRIRIPAALDMTFDPTVTTATLGGTAAGKVSTTPTYESGNKVVVLDVTTNFASNDQLTIAGLKFRNFGAVSAASSLELVIAGSGGSAAATDDKTITIIAVATLSSAAHQTFSVGQASTAAATITVTDSSTPTITAAQDIRIRIPPGLSMTFDTAVTSVTLGGTAAGKVNATGLTYEDSNKTVRLNVTSDFSSGQTLTITGLKFTNFTAVSTQNLQLVVSGSGGATAAIDDKTITITGGTGGGITSQQTISACIAPGGGGVIAVSSATTNTGSGSTVDVTHTVSGSDRLMLVGISTLNNSDVISVVWDPGGANESLSLVTGCNRISANGEMWMFRLVAPATGTRTLRVTFATSESAVVGVTSFTGVNQTTPLGTCVVANGDPGPATVTVSSAAGELVFDTIASDENVTANASQSVLWDVTTPANGGGSTKAGASSVTMTWSAGSTGWAIGAVPIKPASGSTTSVTLPPWTPQANELLLVGVALRDETVVPSVSGNGLTWTQIADRDNLRGEMGVNLFRASGMSPSSGSITINLPGNTLPAYAVAIRLSGVDTAVNQGIEAVTTASGPAVTDDANMKVTVTTLTANAWALAWGGQRGSATLTVPAGETILEQSSADCGTSGDRMRGHMWREIVATPGPTVLGQDNSLNSAHPWAVIGVSIKPLGGGSQGPQAPGRFNAFESNTVAGAMTGVLRTKIAGNTISVDITSLNAARTAVDTTFTGAVRVEVLNASNNSAALDADGCRSSWSVIQTLSNPTFSAGDNGRKTVSFTVADSYPDVRLRMSYPTSSPTLIGCSNDNFAIRPSTLANFAVSDTDWQTAGTGRALTSTTFGTVTHKAGRPMSVRATAVNANGTQATTNYTGTPTQWVSACAGTPCTGSFGTLTLGSTFTAGQLATDVASYNDVGSFALQLVDTSYASVDTYDTVGDCGASGSYVCSAAINVGRFVPDNFAVSLNTPAFGSACGAFTYVGQKFNYGSAPVVTLTARNFAGGTTTRYEGSWWRITNATLTGKAYTTASGTLDTSGAPGTDPVINAAGSGAGTLTFSSGTGFFFSRTTPVAPFDAEISLAVNVIDADGVSYASNPARFGTATAGNGIAFSTGKPMRFGRFAIGNAYGSQLVPLLVRVEAQYWSGSAFITNTLDNCTSVAPANYAMSNYTGNLSPSPNCRTAINGGGTLSSGRGTLILATPGAANDGSVILTANLGATASGSTCTTLGGAPVSATTANLPHLQGNWSGGAYDANPSGRATFGVYKGSEEIIYMRENF